MKDDARLYADAVEGGPDEFAPIVDRYRSAVFGVALARLADFHRAEDVAQDVFVAAYERLGSLEDPNRLGAWLRSIAIHRSIDALRRQRGEAALPEESEPVGPAAEPQEELERRERREQVLAAVAGLSGTQRETTTLFYIDGYSVAEVAAMQEVPVGTVKCRLHDARKKLKERVIDMVADTLRSEAPREDFSEKVFGLLSRHRLPSKPPWSAEWKAIGAELRKIGARGTDGFIRALESSHSPTRILATRMLHETGQTGETVIELLKKCLADPNRKVRRFAFDALLWSDVGRERKAREFLPLVLPLLQDRSRTVRRELAWRLGNEWADAVPVEPVVRALLAEERPSIKGYQERLLRAILAARDAEKEQTD